MNLKNDVFFCSTDGGGGFKFGAAATTAGESSKPSGFTFGAAPAAAATAADSTKKDSGFTFGAVASKVGLCAYAWQSSLEIPDLYRVNIFL